MWGCACIHISVCLCVRVSLCLSVHMCVYVYECVCVCIFRCICVRAAACACMRMCLCICICVRVCVYMCVRVRARVRVSRSRQWGTASAPSTCVHGSFHRGAGNMKPLETQSGDIINSTIHCATRSPTPDVTPL